MSTTTVPTTTRSPLAGRGTPTPHGTLWAVGVCVLLIGAVTLIPSGPVADVRAAVMDSVHVLAGPWTSTVHRAPVEAVANALLFLPFGTATTLVCRHLHRAVPLVAGVVLSAVVELAQALLPGRVPDVGDLAANTAGTAAGVALAAVFLARRSRGQHQRSGVGRRRTRPGRSARTAVLVASIPVAAVLLAACLPSIPGTVTTAPDGSPLTSHDGFIAEGQTVSAFDDVPAVTRLDDELLAVVREAQSQATADGVEFHLASGWRSERYQGALLAEAATTYGSEREARRWVMPPQESAHVRGQAVDIGPTDAMSWLSQHGADLGLCQIYTNEMWHYELRTTAGGSCPDQVPDAAAG